MARTKGALNKPKRTKKGKLIEKNSMNCSTGDTGSTTGSTTGSMKVTYVDGSTKYFTGLTSIEEDTDSNKDNAKEVIIYDGVTSIIDHIFDDCSSLTGITIPNSVTSIGTWAFSGCRSLTGIVIPNSVTSIGRGAFEYCTSLSSITITDRVTSIGDYAFFSCSSLSSITVDTGNTVFDSRDNCNAIIRTSDNTLIFGCKATVIPNSVTSIGEAAFRDCTSLTGITIPDSVTSIGNSAFAACSSLTGITIPNSVTSIGDYAFRDCTGLASVTIQNSSSKLYYNYQAFETIASNAKLYVPSNLLSNYQSDSKWTRVFKGGIYAIGS